jgi:hypothetical protein
MTDQEAIPGPGTYNTNLKETIRREPVWTIGRRSRKSAKSRGSGKEVERDLVAVDQAIVHLEDLPNPAAARLFIMTHPELSRIVHDILNYVFGFKPADPISFIAEHMGEIVGESLEQ